MKSKERAAGMQMRAQGQRLLIPGHSQPEMNGPSGKWTEQIAARALGMKRKAATGVLFGLSVLLGLYAIFGHDGLVAYQQKQHQAEQLHQQILDMQKENQRLALHDQRLKDDPDTIEYEAREQMHYTRPGEVIYTLPDIPAATQHK